MNEWVTTDSRPKLLAGSAEGYTGHVDGKLRQARMNHPKGLTVDDSGNVYIADTMNMAIRKITDTGKNRQILPLLVKKTLDDFSYLQTLFLSLQEL